MIVVTGGAGLIGSALIWGLNQRGQRDIMVVDDLDHPEKERNLQPLHFAQLVGIQAWRREIKTGRAAADAVLHMGAISSTFEKNWTRLQEFNVTYTQDVLQWAINNGVGCVYASSAATYGDGRHGYSDDHALFEKLQPLNWYGKSKLLVDIWARDNGYLEQVVGLRYFNVFGPNEYHKGDMRSVVAKKFDEWRSTGRIALFKSNHPNYKDGEQRRDFVYIKDAVAATLFFLDHPSLTGVYNIGSGRAETWNVMAQAMGAVLGRSSVIEYIAMPTALADQYQNFTQADISKLRAAGYDKVFTPVNAAVTEYMQQYLTKKAEDGHDHRHLGE